MRQATTEQLWNLDNDSLKDIKYLLNSASHVARLNLIMAKVKFTNDEISKSDADNSKSKSYVTRAKQFLPENTKSCLCKTNSVDSDTSTNDSAASEDMTDTSLYNMKTQSNSFENIIKQIEKIRFIRASAKVKTNDLKTKEKSNFTKSMNSLKKCSSDFTKDDALNSNYCKQNYQTNVFNDMEDKDEKGKLNNIHFDHLSEDEDDVYGNLIERGPVRPQLNTIRSKPYDTLDWLLQSDNYSAHECSDRQHNEASDYETRIQQLLTDGDYRERLDSCLNQLNEPDSGQKPGMYNGNNILETVPRERHYSSHQAMMQASTKTPPEIIVNNPDEDFLLDILARGGFQAAQVFSDSGITNGSSAGMNSEVWPDSPASSYNVITSRPNSRASSRAQSPGSAMTPINIVGSPTGSPQVSLNFRSQQCFSSSSSSNQSYCETPSPANYQSPLDYRSEDQLDDRFNRFISWQENNESSGTIVANNTSELIDAIDSSELQLVEEVLLKELSRKSCNQDEAHIVPNSHLAYRKFETHNSVQSPVDKDSRSLNCDQRVETINKNIRTNMNFYSDSLNFGSTGSIINEAQQSLVYPKNGDGFDLVYSENPSSIGSCRENMSPVNGYTENHSPVNKYIGKPLPASLEIDATIENMLAHYSKANEEHDTNSSMNFDMDLFECAKSTCTTYSSSRTVQSQHPNLVSQQTLKPTFEFQVPEVMKRHSLRHVSPWSSLNLPSSKACDKLIEELNPKDVERAMASLLKKTPEELAKPDKDGDTMLMCLAGNQDELMKKNAYLLPLVERLSRVQGALSMTNNRGEDALYLMAINCPKMANMTSYLAATMLQKGIPVGQKLYQPKGDTLIHIVATKGNSHEAVLAELLALKTIRGDPIFNVSAKNYEGKTALHMAVESHDPVGERINSIGAVKLLLKNGADLMIKESIRGDTALHTAVYKSCDPILVQVLLSTNNKNVIDIRNYLGNTPLHLATMSNCMSLENQNDVCRILLENGAKTSIPNRNSRTPLEYVHPDRKNSIKTIFSTRTKIH